jgi:hypothetical protein
MSKSGERYKTKAQMKRHERPRTTGPPVRSVPDMPLTKKGKKIMAAMEAEYGKEKAQRVFYAMANSGKLKGVDFKRKRR